MADSWEEMKRAKEDMFFAKQNEEALKKMMASRAGEVRKSPISGKPMEQVALNGVIIDRCTESGGIWLDNGELEKILSNMQKEKEEERGNWLTSLFHTLQK